MLFFFHFSYGQNEVKKIDSLPTKPSEKAKLFHKYSVNYYMESNLKLAIKYGLQEIEQLNATVLDNTVYDNALFNVAYFYLKENNFYKSISYSNQIITRDFDKNKTAQSYCNIGHCYNKIGNLEKAILFYQKGIIALSELNKTSSLLDAYIDLSRINTNLDNLKSTKNAIHLLDRASKLEIVSNTDYYRLNNSYAYAYSNDYLYDFDLIKSFYLKNLSKSLINKDSIITSAMYNNLGELYIRKKKDSAIYFLKESLKFSNKNHDKCNTNISKYYYSKTEYEKSLKYLSKALPLDEKLNKLNIINNKYKTFLLVKYSLLIDIYIQKYLQTKKISYIDLAMDKIRTVDFIIDVIRGNHLENNSKLFWQKEVSPIFTKAIYCCDIKNNNNLASYYVEKNKSILLLDSSTEKFVKSKLPKEVLSVEEGYKKTITNLKTKLITTNNKDSIQNLVFITSQKFSRFHDSIKKKYPKFYTLNSEKITSLKEIQASLLPNEMVVSFNWNKDSTPINTIFELIITKKEVRIINIPNSEIFKSNLKSFKKQLVSPFNTQKDIKAFTKVAHYLYKNFFPSKEIQTLITNKKIIIIPDGEIQNIPFEALVTNMDTYNYLIESSEICYAYSMSYLLKNNQFKREPTKNFIGFAPITFGNQNLNTLKHSEKEINTIYKGDLFTSKNATKQLFLEQSNNYNMIHLATHADANTTITPWIAFNSNKLTLDDIYTTNTQADLVVLSGCKTSLGEVATGEGVLSLSRGFFYSGAKTVVSSLWNVNDQSTTDLISSFYKNLKEGSTKSKALQQAKINYLNTHSLSDRSPYYWSSFILIGDAGKLHQLPNTNYWYFVLFGIIAFLVIIRLKKTSK